MGRKLTRTKSGERMPSKAQYDDKKPVSRGRHEYHCSICALSRREELELAFVNWSSPARIAKEFRVSRDSVYRHAHALALFEKRRRNVRVALERIIENAGEVEVSAAAVVGAVNQVFDRMTRDEMEAYAKDGQLPTWFERAVGATAEDSPDELDLSQTIEKQQ